MFKPEEQQVEICLLKSNLEEIENDLVLQRSALPALDAENERKCRETMTALRVARSLNIEIERLKLENVQLTAKRMQLKRQSDDLSKGIDKARAAQSELTELLKKEEKETELHVAALNICEDDRLFTEIRQYEDSLEEIAERFRKTRGYYNKNEVNIETEKVNKINMELTNELQRRQSMMDELKQQLDMLQPDIPEDILVIILKEDLDTQVRELTEKCEDLLHKRDSILNKKKNVM